MSRALPDYLVPRRLLCLDTVHYSALKFQAEAAVPALETPDLHGEWGSPQGGSGELQSKAPGSKDAELERLAQPDPTAWLPI